MNQAKCKYNKIAPKKPRGANNAQCVQVAMMLSVWFAEGIHVQPDRMNAYSPTRCNGLRKYHHQINIEGYRSAIRSEIGQKKWKRHKLLSPDPQLH